MDLVPHQKTYSFTSPTITIIILLSLIFLTHTQNTTKEKDEKERAIYRMIINI